MRVLLVKMSSLGDIVHALPAVTDAIKHGYTIDWVVEEAFADVARMHTGVNSVIPIAWRRWGRSLLSSRAEMKSFFTTLREHDYDVVLDSQGLLKSAVVTRCARASVRAGYSGGSAREPMAALAYGRRARVPGNQHAVDRQRQLFAALLDYIPGTEMDAGLTRAETHPGRVFLLHGTTWDTKHWPDSMWIELAKHAVDAKMCPTLTWGNDVERQRAEAIASAVHEVVVIPRSELAELVDNLAASELVIGVDSGLTHLSAALGVPTLGLYGPTNAKLTGCRGVSAASLQADLACAPCMEQHCTRYRGEALIWADQVVTPPCFAKLNPDRVWADACRLKDHCPETLN